MPEIKITKKPKHVDIKQRKVESYITSYQCPTCKVFFEGCGPARNVIRFRCSCGQELMVN